MSVNCSAHLTCTEHISDTTFASTVDSVRFQEEGVALMLQRETVPQYLQLQLDGQTHTLQVGSDGRSCFGATCMLSTVWLVALVVLTCRQPVDMTLLCKVATDSSCGNNVSVQSTQLSAEDSPATSSCRHS